MTGETPRQQRLDRATIVNAALQALDADGLDALSTRALADRLGVKSPALYWHFKNKRELIDAMAIDMLEHALWPAPPDPGDDLRLWLIERGRAFRQALLARRDGARVHAGMRPTSAHLDTIEAQVLALVTAGLPLSDAARAALAISRYTLGWVLEEQTAAPAGEHDGGIELAGHPALAAASDVFTEADQDRDYDYGLRALVDGILCPSGAPDHPTAECSRAVLHRSTRDTVATSSPSTMRNKPPTARGSGS